MNRVSRSETGPDSGQSPAGHVGHTPRGAAPLTPSASLTPPYISPRSLSSPGLPQAGGLGAVGRSRTIRQEPFGAAALGQNGPFAPVAQSRMAGGMAAAAASAAADGGPGRGMASGLGSESNEGGGLSGYPVSSGLGSGLGSPAGPTGLGGSGSLGPVGLGGPAALGGSGLGGSGLSGSGLGAGSLGSSGSGGSPGLGAGGGQGGPAISVAPRKLAGRRRRETVAVLIFSGAPIFESSIPLSVFGVDRQDAGVPRYRLLVCAGEDGPLTTTGGVTLTAPFGLEALARAGTIVVPAWRSISQPPPVEAIAALRKAHHEGARIIGLCTGAFVLAAAGLLDGRPATTHWMYAPTLAKRYPRVHVDPRELFVDDGDVLTSAGTAAGIDLCLHVVRSDHGAEAANALARRLVVPNRAAGAVRRSTSTSHYQKKSATTRSPRW